jgi:hypothetical protein
MTTITMITSWSSSPLAGGKEPTKGERGGEDDGDDNDGDDDDGDDETTTTVTKTMTMNDDNNDGNNDGDDDGDDNGEEDNNDNGGDNDDKHDGDNDKMTTRQRRDNDERRSDNQLGRTRGNCNEMAMIGQRQAARLLALHQPFEETINKWAQFGGEETRERDNFG